MGKADFAFIQRVKSSARPVVSPVLSERQKASMERINRLALPKGYRQMSGAHVRSHTVGSLTANDLFGHLDDHGTVPEKSQSEEKICNDERFHQLVQTCSDIHLRDCASELRSVENIIQSNPSLQDQQTIHHRTNKNKKKVTSSLRRINSCFEKRSIHLMDIGGNLID